MRPRPPTPSSIPSKLTVNFVLPYDSELSAKEVSMLKVPDHQVAGHQACNGVLGPLIDGSGHFFKPLQNDNRGSSEASFYSSFSSDTMVPHHIRRFFPQFYGTKLLQASDGSGLHPHLVLEDIVCNYVNPSVLDMKIGSRTWYPEATDEYIAKCVEKDRESSSLRLGFRLSGVQVYGSKERGYWKLEKKVTRKYSVQDCKWVLRQFVSSKPSGKYLDCCYAPAVYGGSGGIMGQLTELKAWFEEQTTYHFYSCSVLMVYDGEGVKEGRSPNAVVKLVDFAHVVEGKGVIDHNFLGGLCSLINCISQILARPPHSEPNCL